MTEAIALFGTPPSLVLILVTALAIRFRSQWGGLVTVILWTMWTSAIIFVGADDEVQSLAIAEGCIGSPALFLFTVAAICVGTVLYTLPKSTRL